MTDTTTDPHAAVQAAAERLIDADEHDTWARSADIRLVAQYALASAERERRLRTALERYGVHERFTCEMQHPCECGLDAAIADTQEGAADAAER